MEEVKSILHELYVFCEWKPEPEYIQKPDSILPENISAIWRWLKFFGPKKSLIDSITAHKERQQKWHMALGDEGKVIAVLTDNILEIRTKRSEYATIAARTTVSRDSYPQWRKLVWSPDCSFLVLAYGNGVVSFFDLTASNLFNIPIDCSRPGGLECTDNTHAVADIIFMPLRVKDNKWNWEVVVVTYDGKVRGYVVSQTEGCKLHHTFRFPGGVAAVAYSPQHATLYVAGLPRIHKDPSSPLSAGITAWRILNDDPFYKLSVVSDQLESQLANEPFQLYIPFVSTKNMAFIVQMALSACGSRLACAHCGGGVSLWALPALRCMARHPLPVQPHHDARSPLRDAHHQPQQYHAPDFYVADLNWWSEQEIIVSRFSGAVTVCRIDDMVNILGKKPEFFQGTPRVTCAHDGAFMVLECETNVLPARKAHSDESMEVVKVESEEVGTLFDSARELVKWVLYSITDMETFQPRPRPITVVSRVYRLLAVKSTTPDELFARKIESGNYTEALTLADTFNLDSDLVYQQQWRKNPVSSEAIEKYLSKVSKKIWAVHQCVDRLPETLPAANELLQFGLRLTERNILDEINKDREENPIEDPEDITLEDLNAYTSELLRCRHVMLFYKERLRLYEAILRCEKSTYVKDEYDRLRSNSIVYSSMEIAKEGRIEALTCLWPNIKTVAMQLAVLENLPETINPLDYQHLLPTKQPVQWFEKKSPIKIKPSEHEHDWCRKQIFRSIWSSNWSEEATPETETAAAVGAAAEGAAHAPETAKGEADIAQWYMRRARQIEQRSGLASHALTLVTVGSMGGVSGLDTLMFHLLTLDTLVYDINVEGVTLHLIENMSILDTCTMLMKMSTPATFVADLKQFVIPFLKRYENLTKRTDACLNGLTDYLESISVDDLSSILLVLQSPSEFELDVRTHLELAERCLLAHTSTDQLDKACDLLDTILKESDGSISSSELVRRVSELERLVSGSGLVGARGVPLPPAELRQVARDPPRAAQLLTRLARELALSEEKPTPQDWSNLLKDLLELQSSLFTCVTKEQVYEIYASALLTSGDAASIRLAAEVVCPGGERGGERSGERSGERRTRALRLVSDAAREYFNSASSLSDPALDLARCCLTLIKDGNPEIEEELDLIAALQILSAFDLEILPIQVRLCEDRMTLIEDCLKSDPNAYLASHKLLKLAKLLRIAGDDEQTREGQVLLLVGEYALAGGAGGVSAARAAARRLAALRCAAAAPLLARVAARDHADRAAAADLYAAAAAHCPPADLEDVLRSRLELQLEELQQLNVAAKEHDRLAQRWPSTDDEFADAITTPVIEKKDLVAPDKPAKNPLFNYLLDTFQNKFTLSEGKSAGEDCEGEGEGQRCVRVQEFYRSLYGCHEAAGAHYAYDRFSAGEGGPRAPALSALSAYYGAACLDDGASHKHEIDVLQQCAQQLLYSDTALAVSCVLRGSAEPAGTCALRVRAARVPLTAALYATLVRCNAPDLRDNVYRARPLTMARTTLKQKNASEEQLEVIRECIEKLSGMGEVDRLRRLGYQVNGLLFNADEDYRTEIIYRVARSVDPEHGRVARALAAKYGLEEVEVWLQHAAALPSLAQLPLDALPALTPQAHPRILSVLWPTVRGSDHKALLALMAALRAADERAPVAGLTAADHIKLLKKARAASPELDYKLLVEQPSAEQFTAHMLQILKPENVGMVGKFLRTLPPVFKLPVSVNVIYTTWLTKYFFSVPAGSASSKKWMQQYRQCASYFNKLGKDDLLRFIQNTCFSLEAVERVPAGTRNLMIMQAVDYCQQEQENDFKFNKSEQTWSQVGQELTRWARFLENFHSAAVRNIIEANDPDSTMWTDIEMSHGDPDKMLPAVSRLVAYSEISSGALSSLLHCLHVELDYGHIFEHAMRSCSGDVQEMERVVSRICQFHKQGVKFTSEAVEAVVVAGRGAGLPAGRAGALRALRPRAAPARAPPPADLPALAAYSRDLLTDHWPDEHATLTDDMLMNEQGRQEIFAKVLEVCDTWQRKKAFVDILNCWPPNSTGEGHSLHYKYIHTLLTNTDDQKENLELIKSLLSQLVLTDEELKLLMESVTVDNVVNGIWVVLLSKCERSQDIVMELVLQHKEYIQKQEIDEELIKEMLDSGMFLKLVSTPLYSATLNYILTRDPSSAETNSCPYNVEWATKELLNANYLAEAGHLQLLAMGVPSPLRGFSQSILYCKTIFNK